MNSFNHHLSLLLLFSSAACALAAPPGTGVPASKPLSATQQARLREGYGKLPLSFEANQGQTDSLVKFLSHGDGYSLFLTPDEAVLSLRGKDCSESSSILRSPIERPRPCAASPNSLLRMKLLGSNTDARIEGQDALPGKSNYFTGNDSSKWHTNIVNFRKVQYREVYPGIDLVYYGNQRQLEHDFIVAPGVDPKAIRLNFTGARRISVDKDGDLNLSTPNGIIQLKKPVIYQETKGVRRQVAGRYVKKGGNEIGFSLGAYDQTERLVIDPVLVYSTYFGGTINNQPAGIAADPEGDVYITGITQSADFPLVNPIFYNPPNTTRIGFISKISPDGSSLIYSTFLGAPGPPYGNDVAFCSGIAVDGMGNAYVTGYTSSKTFPVVNALQPKLAGSVNAFVTKLNAAGSALDYSTYLGGSTSDLATAIAVDSLGAAYITGLAGSQDFPTMNPFSKVGGVFVSKLIPAGSALEYSTRLGDRNPLGYDDVGYAIAVNSLGEAMVTGYTTSRHFPVKNPLYATLDPVKNFGFNIDYSTVFVTKLDRTGSGFSFSTLLGGGKGYGIATNASGDMFVTGVANSPRRFSTDKSLYPAAALPSTFVTRIRADGSSSVYSTYLGSAGSSRAAAIAVDAAGNAYISGETLDGLPVIDPVQPTLAGNSGYPDAFLTKLDPPGSRLLFSTYLGGIYSDAAVGLAIDGKGDMFIAGSTLSPDFPLKGALRSKLAAYNGTDGFVAKISGPAKQFSITNTVDHAVVSPGGDLHYTVTVTNNGSDAASGILSVSSVRDRFRACQVSNGDLCKFVILGGRATVNLAPLAHGESRTILIYATAAKTAGDYNLIPNTATISTGPPLNETDTATATTTVRQTADIAIASTLVDSTNGVLHYVHTVTNLGPDNSHAVLLLDPLPAHTGYISASTTRGECSYHPTLGAYGAVRCPLNKPPAGGFVQIDVFLQAFMPACPAVTNTTTVISKSIDTQTGNDSVTVVTQLPQSLCVP